MNAIIFLSFYPIEAISMVQDCLAYMKWIFPTSYSGYFTL